MKRYITDVLLVLVLLVAAYSIGAGFVRNGPSLEAIAASNDMEEWEYKTQAWVSEQNANVLGAQGWELICVSAGNNPTGFFKRRKR